MNIDDRLRSAANRAAQLTKGVKASNLTDGIFPQPQGQPGAKREQLSHYRDFVYASIRPIAQRIAGQPVNLSRRTRAGLDPIQSHPILDAINDPNDWLVRWSLIYLTVAHLELTGSAFWWLVPGKDRPLEIWPLSPGWIEKAVWQGRNVVRWVVRLPNQVEPFTVEAADMAYFAYPDPADPWGGSLGPLQCVGRAVSADDAIQCSQHAAFTNGINPSVAITVGRHPDSSSTPGSRMALTRDQRLEIHHAIRERHAGASKHGLPLILDAIIEDVKPLSMKPKEMDFTQSSGLTKARITQGFGVNPIIMGEIEGANRASAVVAESHFIANTVGPKCDLISQIMTAWVAQRYGKDLVLEIPRPLVSDDETKRDNFHLLNDARAVTTNELRAAYGLEPVPEGDKLPALPLTPVKTLRRKPRKKSPSAPTGRAARLWIEHHGQAEALMASTAQEFFASQAKEILEAYKGPETPVEALVPLDWDERLKTWMRAPVLRIAAVAALAASPKKVKAAEDEESSKEELLALAALLLSLGVSIGDLGAGATDEAILSGLDLAPEVVQGLRAFADEVMSQPYWASINETLRRRIGNLLTQGLAEGMDADQIAAMLETELASMSRTRAILIGQTETTGAYNQGMLTSAKLIGAGQLEWRTMLDEAVRPTHTLLHGNRVTPGGLFNVGGFLVPYPAHHSLPPEERCNCRCFLV